MTTERITIDAADANAAENDRFHRFNLISWWDQRRLAAAKVLVIGAGALGNEIIKNLSLLGVGNVFIADLDRIENSNLSRSVLYRESDNGLSKAEVAARAAKSIYPDINVHYFNGNIIHDLGMGVYRWADLVIAGLDNREARLAINRSCWKVNCPWIDGGIEEIHGIARVFVPGGPCYECTMSEIDWRLLKYRRSCNLLSRTDVEQGRAPTTPTISSIIAGVQTQEAVKLLHGLETIGGRGWMFVGLTTDSYQVEYQQKEECYSHDPLDEVIPLNYGASDVTVRQLCELARELVGPDATVELGRDLVEKLVCQSCGAEESFFTSVATLTVEHARCPNCSDGQREVVTFYKLRGDESFADSILRSIGVPQYDILVARCDGRAVGLELAADALQVLGPLLVGEEGLEWA